MRRNEDLRADAWFNEDDDTIRVKICIWVTGNNGQAHKKGIILKLTEESLVHVAEAQQYPIRAVSYDLIDEITNE